MLTTFRGNTSHRGGTHAPLTKIECLRQPWLSDRFKYGGLASPGSASGTRLTTQQHRPRIHRNAVHARRSAYDKTVEVGGGLVSVSE